MTGPLPTPSAPTGRLARAYRLLLRVYPPGPRRDELLGTLLECAAPDRRWPRPGETLNLVRHGMRARLGRPAGRAVVVFAVLVALACGFAGASGAARLAWEAAPPLPSGAESDALKRTVFPGLTAHGGGDAPVLVPHGDGEGLRYGFADYWVEHTAATRDVRAYTDGVRERLAAAGWELRSDVVFEDEPDAVTPVDTVGFWATRDDLVLAWTATLWGDRAWYDSDGAAAFQLSRGTPALVGAATTGGALLGALLGWLLTGFVSRRTEPLPGAGAVAGLLTGLALVLLLPATLYAWGSTAEPGGPDVEPFWMGFVYLGTVPAVLAGLLGLLVLGLAALPGSRRRHRAGVAGALVLLVAGLVAAGWYRDARPAWAGARPCAPAGVPAEPDPDAARLSRAARVFIAQDTPPEQRNLIDAAIFRVWGTTALNFSYDPTSSAYRHAYCGGAPLAAGAGMRLPYFWDVDLSSPGVYPALVAEVQPMPGVLAVRRASAHE